MSFGDSWRSYTYLRKKKKLRTSIYYIRGFPSLATDQPLPHCSPFQKMSLPFIHLIAQAQKSQPFLWCFCLSHTTPFTYQQVLWALKEVDSVWQFFSPPGPQLLLPKLPPSPGSASEVVSQLPHVPSLGCLPVSLRGGWWKARARSRQVTQRLQ